MDFYKPISIQNNHEMVVISRALDWDLFQAISEIHREKTITSNRGLKPHFRALCGAVVVRILKNSNLRDTEDLIRNYLPARYLCDLQNSDWTPDHNTIWEFEAMLGEEGLCEFSDCLLRTVSDLGFADPRGLCADTTAQEAYIPHPTEVGHINTFMKSFRSNLDTLVSKSKQIGKQMAGKLKKVFSEIGEKVRSHRLFAKTKEARMEINQELLKKSADLLKGLGSLLDSVDLKTNQVNGSGKRALSNLVEIYNNFCRMFPEISHWIQNGKVAKGKIVSLFNPAFKAIDRGKLGKQIEFGLKWGINQIRGGYIAIYMHQNMMACDADYAVMAVEEHVRLFGQAPKDFGFDRAAWSAEHKKIIKTKGVKNIAIAPKGKSDWDVGPRLKDKMIRERAQVEGKIGTMKTSYGFNKSNAKTNSGVRRSALRAALCFNLKRFAKDIAISTSSAMIATA
jgi:hypothetical protein